MELDVNEDSRDVDILTVGGKIATGISFSSEKWKFSMISVLSSFFSVLPIVTWDILFELMGKESDQKVNSTFINLLKIYRLIKGSTFYFIYIIF